MRGYRLTRREVFALATAGAAGWTQLYAFGSEFWDKKPPSEWSSEEIGKLTTKSPWAKQVSAQVSAGDGGGRGVPGRSGGGGGGMGGPRIGLGIPGIGGGGVGGGGMGGGRRGGGGRGQMPQVKGTVRWESAQTIQDALKTPLPGAFANHYVISVSGFPLRGGGRRQDDDNGDSSHASEKMLDNLKAYTSLEPKGKPIAQPGVVQEQPGGAILFGFSKEALDLSADDKEVAFSTQIGRAMIKTKFDLKDMKYRGKLAL
jgi:hypothetical protein